jgi:hypothetical protein
MSAAFGQANQVDAGHFSQDREVDSPADLQAVRFAVRAKLADESLGLAIRLWYGLDFLGGPPLLTVSVKIGDLTSLGAGGLLAALVCETQLNGFVPVAILGPHRQNRARTRLDDCDGVEVSLAVIDLRHADFAAQQSDWHGCDFPNDASSEESEIPSCPTSN